MDTPVEVKPSLPPLPLALESKLPPESPPRTIMQMVTPGIRARRNKRLLLYFPHSVLQLEVPLLRLGRRLRNRRPRQSRRAARTLCGRHGPAGADVCA